MKTVSLFPLKILSAAVVLAFPLHAAAQQLEEIIVTATKRAQSVQDIPQSVEAFSGERLQNMGIADISTLAASIPNFFVGDGVVTTNVTMRGMGSSGERSFEQSVGMFIDDIYMPRSRQYRSPFFDAERVEILRGPQAVLFGLNSTAGAVSVHSARSRPGEEFVGEVTASYETEYNGTNATLVLGGSPTESLGLRFAAQYSDSDGYFDNTFTGETEGNRDSNQYRFSAVWEPTDGLTIDAKYETVEFDIDGNFGEIFGTFAADLDGGDGQLNYRRHSDSQLISTYPTSIGGTPNVQPGLYQEADNFSLKVEYLIGEHTLTGIYGYSDTEYSFGLDLDTFAGSLVDPTNGAAFFDASVTPEKYEQDSYEIRLTSPGGETFDYLAGLYYQESDLSNNYEQSVDVRSLSDALVAPDFCVGFGLCGAAEYMSLYSPIEQELWSAYAAVTWNVSDTFRATLGARYTDEEKSSSREGDCQIYDPASGTVLTSGFLNCSTVLGVEDSRTSDNFMPEFLLQWDIGEAMLYGKVGTSAKAGGYAFVTTIGSQDDWEFDDETVITYELGYKTRFADGAAELNISLFRSEFEDLQVNSFTNDGFTILSVISNAGEALTQGIEADGRWAATDWLVLGGSLSLLDAEYTDYKEGACFQESTDPGFPVCDFSGESLPYAPDFSGTLYGDVTLPIGGNLNFVGNITAAYTEEYYTDGSLSPVGLQDSYTRVSARAGIEAADGKWSLAVIGSNLTDEVVLDSTQAIFGYYLGYIGAPRTVMLQGVYRFGG